MDSSRYDHLQRVVHITLYVDVSNAKALRQRIVSCATSAGPEGDAERALLNFAFIDARLITSILHLKTAIYQAILVDLRGSLRTKTVHSEVLWALSPNNNISEAIRRYGVSDTSTSLFVVRIDPIDAPFTQSQMDEVVSGTVSPLATLESITDWTAVKKYHKLNAEQAVKDAAGDVVREHVVIDKIVTSSVAMKNVAQ